MRNNIYYLLDFHKKCCQVINYDKEIIDNYCNYVKLLLDKNFDKNEQSQLQLNNINFELIYKCAYGEIDDISFDNLDKIKLNEFFDKISFVDIEKLY
jgi:hypothetical protein